MKYSDRYRKDFKWYLSVRNVFNFDGRHFVEVVHDRNGLDGLKAFYLYDSQGKLNPTRHPTMLQRLIKTKGSVNMHIKMYATGRADGTLPRPEFEEMAFSYPDWFSKAVENQKYKYYKVQ